MAGFADVTRLALQPGVVEQDPAFARALVARDLARTQQGRQTQRETATAATQHRFQGDLRARQHEAARGFRRLSDRERRPPSTAGAAQQSLLDGILREQALAQYDREAPLLREALRAARG